MSETGAAASPQDALIAQTLGRPYIRTVIPTEGTFHAEMFEFPGCIATGETAGEALRNLERVAASWLYAALVQGQKIPEPLGYSMNRLRIYAGIK